jgi:hypothetical protein
METNLTGFNFSILDISFVSNQTNWNIWTHFSKVLVPFIDISVSVSWSEIKHDDSAIGINIVTFSQFSKLLLTSSVPDIKGNFSQIGIEDNRGDLSSFSWNVWLLEMTCIVSFGESCLTNTTITDQNKLELSSDILWSGHIFIKILIFTEI